MKKRDFFLTLRYAGAFIAWVIGSGFATGQEILQFFGGFGYQSIAVLAVNFVGFLALGLIIVTRGYEHREADSFSHYEYYCGKTVGKIYSVVIRITLVLIISVLISAAGATLEQYYSVDRRIGSVVMAALLLTAYLAGFEKMVKIISCVSPFVIVFSVFVGGFTVIKDAGNFGEIGRYTQQLSEFRTAPHWLLSSVLYLSLNFLTGSTYYTQLGRTAEGRRPLRAGAVLGALALLLTIAAVNFAELLNAKDIVNVPVPTLFLAEKISGVFGTVFAAVLLLGMFSSCSTMIWSFCSGFFSSDRKKNRLFSAAAVLVCTLLGFVPFGDLVAAVYPMIGYAGLVFIALVIYNGIKSKIKEKTHE